MRSEPAVPIDALLAQRGWVRALARTLVADGAAADDLEQQAWVEALERPPSTGGSLRAWFATVLRRRARDQWRERGRRAVREEAAARPESGRSTADIVAEADAHRRVVDAIMGLEAPYRETLLLRFFEDLPPREIAARQGVPVETVRTRTRRALERMRERLDGANGGNRAAWVAVLVPLTGVRWESAAITGGTIMASKAAVGAVVAAAVVGGVVGGVVARPSSTPAEASPAVAALEARIEQLESRASAPAATPAKDIERIEALQVRIARIEERSAAAPTAASSIPAGSAPASSIPAESEAARAEREKAVRAGVEALDAARKDRDVQDAKVADLRRVVLDRSLTDEERMKALQQLRFLPTGIDAEVVNGLVSWFRESSVAGTREAILREVHNKKAPEFKALFIDALRNDADEAVRIRAASDIDVYKDDATVVQALESARDGDASEKVRKRAARTLESGKSKD